MIGACTLRNRNQRNVLAKYEVYSGSMQPQAALSVSSAHAEADQPVSTEDPGSARPCIATYIGWDRCRVWFLPLYTGPYATTDVGRVHADADQPVSTEDPGRRRPTSLH